MFAFGQRHCLLCLCVKFLRPVGQWTNQLRLRTLLLFLPPAVICVYPNRIEPTLGPLPFWSWRGAFALRRTLNFGFRSQRRLFAPESMLCLMHVRVYCIVPDPAPVSATPPLPLPPKSRPHPLRNSVDLAAAVPRRIPLPYCFVKSSAQLAETHGLRTGAKRKGFRCCSRYADTLGENVGVFV